MEATHVRERFERASHFERQLTARQKRVLDLIVEGRTNGEIAAELGMTLDGAKWNVSEILTKLGLSGREEAADYWRWRHRRTRGFANLMRALLPVTAVKWAGGVAGLAVVGAMGVVLFDFARESGARTTPRLEFEAVTTLQGGGSHIHAWYAGPELARCETRSSVRHAEIQSSHSADDVEILRNGMRSLVMDSAYTNPGGSGTHVSFYEDRGEALRCIGSLVTAPLGASLDDAVAALEADDVWVTEVVVEGTDTVLGRPVTVLGLTLTRGDVFEPGEPRVTTQTARVWYDEELGLVLREEREIADGESSSSATYEVTRLDLEARIDDALFEVEVPVGAEIQPPIPTYPTVVLGDGSSTTGEIRDRRGLYVPAGQPGDWKLMPANPLLPGMTGDYSTHAGYAWSVGGPLPTATIWFDQQYPAAPAAREFEGAPTVTIDGHEAQYVVRSNGEVAITWEMDSLPQNLNIVRVTVTLWGVGLDEFVDLFPKLFTFRR